jgi:hypothetical protein
LGTVAIGLFVQADDAMVATVRRKARELVGTPLRGGAVFMDGLSPALMREKRVLKAGMVTT